MDTISLLQKRRSTRHFDPSVKMTENELKNLLELAGLSPSSCNSQPWRFIVLTEQHLKDKLLPIAHNQEQISKASAVIVLLADREAYKAESLTKIYQAEFEKGFFNTQIRDFLTEGAISFYNQASTLDEAKYLGLDIGLCAMSLMLAAEQLGWQSVPMTGYDPKQLRSEFQIPERYLDVLIIAVGKGTKEGHDTLRLPTEETCYWNTFPTE